MSHITGGGLANNLARVVPDGVEVVVDRASWTPPAVFDLVRSVGGLSGPDVEATLNQGVGMVVLLPAAEADAARALLAGVGVDSWVAGRAQAVDGRGSARLVGAHSPAG